MNCEEIREKLTSYCLGDLPESERADVAAHLEQCEGCRAERKEVEQTLDLLRDALAAPSSVAEPAVRRLTADRRARVFDEGAARRSSRVLRWFALPHPQVAVLAAACIVVAFVLGAMMLPALSSARERARRVVCLSAVDGDVPPPAIAAGTAPVPADSTALQTLNGTTVEPWNSGLSREGQAKASLEKGEGTHYRYLPQAWAPATASSGRELAGVPPAAPAKTPRSGADPKADDGIVIVETPEPSQIAKDVSKETDLKVGSDLYKAGRSVAEGRAGRMGAGGGVPVGGEDRSGEEKKEEAERLSRGVAATRAEDGWARSRRGTLGIGGGIKAKEDLALAAPPAQTPTPSAKPDSAIVFHVPGRSADGETAATAQKALSKGEATVETKQYTERTAEATVHGERRKAGRANGDTDDDKVADLDESRVVNGRVLALDSKGARKGDVRRPEDRRAVVDKLAVGDSVAPPPAVVSGPPARPAAGRGEPVREDRLSASTLFGSSLSVVPSRNEADNLPPKFKAFGVNPFVEAAGQPFSTFSIDVDTASYTVSRNYMLRGQRPPAEAVRTEEFVNFFDYAYGAPARETFRVYADVAPSKFGRGLHLLKIGIKGKRLGREEQRGAVLTFLVDTSGSMDKPDRIGLIRKSLKLLVERLGPQDQVAIVQFGSNARLVLDHTPASDKAKIVAAVDALQCSGSTNLEEGMFRAYEAAAASFRPKGENRVLILSDGVANLGAVAAEDILGKVESFRRQGIYCSVFGFGMGTFDDTMLEALANKGNGTYAFVDSDAEANRLFVEDLAATLNTVAVDVKIQVEFSPRVVAKYRQLGYENRQLKKEDFRNDAVDAGEVGSGQSVTALYEMEMKPDARGTIATVRVRYRRTDTGKVEEIDRPVTGADLKAAFDQADARFRLAACVAELAEKLRGSSHAAGSEFTDIAAALEPVALDLRLDPRVQELLGLVRSAGSLSIAAE